MRGKADYVEIRIDNGRYYLEALTEDSESVLLELPQAVARELAFAQTLPIRLEVLEQEARARR